MKRRKIDKRTISPRRPDVSLTRSIDVNMFTHSLKKFADEYLRAALELTVRGKAFGVLNISLADTAYMLRLMVEYGGETSVLKTDITLDAIITLDTYFPCGLPSISDISKIKAAGNAAGFHFELRESRIIFRAKIMQTGRVSIYAGNLDVFFDTLLDIFFCP
ncbi:MAG: hypothetical protein IJW48_02255 [Clostridia bacterium]|nr:hypothetical protein [Clostridia bacterium]